jgi:hypothetical protein
MAAQQVVFLLEGVCSIDNDSRRAAEAQYEQLRTSSPEILATALVAIIQESGPQMHIRELAAILLRRLVSALLRCV